ncbi:MAG: pilus assembly protein [Actinobacteria bacterium]|nr:pilus assembly protein [Actinomycetota bacterium]
MSWRLHDQDGSAPVVELALGAPLILAILWLVIWAGAGAQTPSDVALAAQDAARVASRIRTAADRPAAAATLVDGRLANGACSSWSTATTSTDEVVAVTVDCVLDTPQMAGLDVPTRTVTATGRSTIDRFFVQD